ncbi:MAG: HDIG domain-containing protein [Myxococcales bacterium]|jgi:poly(A) polymerase
MLQDAPSDHSMIDTTRALAVLRWAADVATRDPALLDAPPEPVSAEELRALDVASVRAELDRLLLGKHTQDGLDALLHGGVLDVWLPEIEAMVGFSDGEWRHKDVWKHTKQVVWQSVPRLEVRWGALLHDIGKIKTRRIEPNGKVHFFGHSEVGAAMFRKRVARRLGFEGALYDRVHFLILYHLRASQYDRSWTDSAVRRFTREMGEGLKDLLDLSRADITTKRPERRKRGLRLISELASRVEKLRAEDARVPPLPKGLGDGITARFGIPPSKRIGDLRHRLEQEVAAGRLQPGQDADYYLDWMDAHRGDLGL